MIASVSTLSLLGITLKDEEFYQLAQEGAEVVVDVPSRIIEAGGKKFRFGLSLMEERLMAGGGVTEMFKKYQSQLFRVAMKEEKGGCKSDSHACGSEGSKELAW